MRLNAQSRRRITGIWLLLLMLTAVSWWLGRGSGWPAHDPRDIGLVIVVLAFVKIRFVMLDFMEVRYAPTAMRAACEAWVAAVCAAILILCRF
jgi:heme/copper-type cytochrome/quinol oxidase subunit 4